MINRSGIILLKKQPFLDWLRALPDPVDEGMSLAELNEEATIYLVPDWYDNAERDQLVREGFDVMFECELAGWWTDQNAWPSSRTFEMFEAWFEVSSHSMIEDLVEGPIEKDS